MATTLAASRLAWVRQGPPAFLDFAGQAHWRVVVEVLASILGERDADAVTIYCQSWSDWLKYKAIIKKEGEFQNTKQGMLTHPAVKRMEAAESAMRHFQKQFGMNPAARNRGGEKSGVVKGVAGFARKR